MSSSQTSRGIGFLCLRDLVDERADRERLEDVVDRSQPADARMRGRVADLRGDVRHRERQDPARPAADRRCPAVPVPPNRLEIGGNAVRCRQRDHRAVGVQARGQPVGADRVYVVVPHVVFARQLHAHRRARSARDSSAASEPKSAFDLRPNPPPRKVTWTRTFSGVRPEHPRDLRLRGLRVLRGRPDFAAVAADAATATGGSIGMCGRCGTWYSASTTPRRALQRRLRIAHLARDGSRAPRPALARTSRYWSES